MLSRVYEVTLQALKAARNERLWFSTLCKKGRLLVLARDWAALTPLVKELHACVGPGLGGCGVHPVHHLTHCDRAAVHASYRTGRTTRHRATT